MLVALLDAHEATDDPYFRRKAEELYSALRFIGEICPVEGLVPRGPHPNDPTAYYDDSSMDQHTTYIIALARYANQNGFRLNAYLRFLSDEKRIAVIGDLLAQNATMQLERDFPGPMYRKFHTDQQWKELANKYGWNGPELPGAEAAWERYRPELLDESAGLAALAHVRFPLGGYHLVLMSERSELIKRHLSTIWDML